MGTGNLINVLLLLFCFNTLIVNNIHTTGSGTWLCTSDKQFTVIWMLHKLLSRQCKYLERLNIIYIYIYIERTSISLDVLSITLGFMMHASKNKPDILADQKLLSNHSSCSHVFAESFTF